MSDRPPLLYLTHRIPYPPNKGDKLRSFHILRQLASQYRVFLGTFVDDPADAVHVARLNEWCEDIHAVSLSPSVARIASLRGFLSGEPLTVPYYRHAGLRRWIEQVVAQQGIRHALAFSGSMAQYLDTSGLERRVIDFCDVDSAKWTQYAARRSWPMSWLFRREGARLLDFERAAAARADACTFVTEAEAELFRHAAPELVARTHAVENGVDSEFFSPAAASPSPYAEGGPVLVFTGAMDYWPNVDAVCWFVHDILPAIRARHAGLRFYIVGMNPAPAVTALGEQAGVTVTGSVDDIRPWITHADLVCAPLRVARGIQNKVLEAMALARPVVVSSASATGLAGSDGVEYVTASTAEEFVTRCSALLDDAPTCERIGAAARECVLAHYSWDAHLARFHGLLAGVAEDDGAHDSMREEWA